MTQSNIPSYLITITPTINNLFISINSEKTGHLHRTFSFAHIKITIGNHRRRKLFAQEFGSYFAKFLNKLNIKAQYKIKINGADQRCFAFFEYFINNGGAFHAIKIIHKVSFNGCRTSKRKRL